MAKVGIFSALQFKRHARELILPEQNGQQICGYYAGSTCIMVYIIYA